ncbi:MAG: hypothetical protein BAJATHORv1_10236 [Candidatus Thorarchaeota archaeon]|nr:MAG: hypothetical protein BAJATHORv1_10236 [Candidatus Thorarchaeota archaeon]
MFTEIYESRFPSIQQSFKELGYDIEIVDDETLVRYPEVSEEMKAYISDDYRSLFYGQSWTSERCPPR